MASDLPPPVSGWPTPWLTPQEVEQYLFPLHCGSQWRVDFVPKTNCFPTLQKIFQFEKGPSALEFMKDVLEIAEDENHHPLTLQYDEGPRPHVLLGVRTHSANLPPNLLLYFIEHIRPKPPSSIRREGITMRDIRFALIIERRYKNRYAVDQRTKGLLPENDYAGRPFTTVDELLKHLLSHI